MLIKPLLDKELSKRASFNCSTTSI